MSLEKTLEQLQEELIAVLQQDEGLKAEFLANPNAVASRVLGTAIPSFIKLMPIEVPANAILVPLPARTSEDELSDLDLELVAGGKGNARANASNHLDKFKAWGDSLRDAKAKANETRKNK